MKTSKYCLKKGNVFIAIGLLVVMIIFTAMVLVICELNIIVKTVRQDLYYATKNALLSCDVNELSYNNYDININRTREIIQELLNKNHEGLSDSINKIEILDIDVKNVSKSLAINVKVKIYFRSVINLAGKNNYSFELKEELKFSPLEYGV